MGDPGQDQDQQHMKLQHHNADLLALFDGDPQRVADAVASALADGSTNLRLPTELGAAGIDPEAALSLVSPYLRAAARDLGDPGFLAHMDPPTPWITWVVSLLAASSNQNLLHPDTAPAARQLEAQVIDWIAPVFGMGGGHIVPGSTVANLTALWAARDITGADTIVASTLSHLSIRKAAAILGLRYVAIEPAAGAALTPADLAGAFATSATEPLDPAATIVVLTAGTTGVGAIDQLDLGQLDPAGLDLRPAWVHVDAAWAGPMRFSATHRHRLDGIDNAQSVAVSAHKWLHQPKESALIMFNDLASANEAISVGGAYLQAPNVGLLGSHGAAAAPLAATLLLLGLDGVERLIDHGMAMADRLVQAIESHPRLEVFAPSSSGVVAWRHLDHPSSAIRETMAAAAPAKRAFVSTIDIDGSTWLRSVAANPMADVDGVVSAVLAAAETLSAN
ncbi:MAG: pyridoxal phosphate-dependent decarboxylase family protein [Acidimicrobiales bacterium]